MKRILWVEDDARVRAAAERVCKASGVKVGFCFTYLEAESTFAYGVPRDRYTAVVSDFDLGPGPTGADVLAAAECAGIPVRILCSSGSHSSADCPAATAIVDKMNLRAVVEEHLAPLFREGT